MKTLWSYWLIGLTVVLSFSCGDDMDGVVSSSLDEVALAIKVSNSPLGKAKVEGVYMPDRAELGVFLRASDGSTYDGRGFDNVLYTASGEDVEQEWSADPATPVWLSKTTGVAYAYYPRLAEGTQLAKVPIANDETDWMYTERPVSGLSNKQNVAQFSMVHAMTIIRCKVVGGSYTGTGALQSVGVSGGGLAVTAAIDLQACKLTEFMGTDTEIAKEVTGSLFGEPLVVELWAVPTGVESPVTFKVVVDGNPYVVSTPSLSIIPGVVHNFTLTVSAGSITVSSVALSDWSETAENPLESTFDPSDHSVEWEVAKGEDGVYAITADGKALAYEYTIGSEYTGVALVVNGRAYQIANVDARGDDGTNTVYWWQTDCADLEGLPNYTGLTGFVTYSYIPLLDGSYVSTPHLDTNWYNWINSGVTVASTSDFKGKENTDVLVDQLGTTANTIGKAVVDFRNNAELNQGFTDWYAPSLAQLACIGIMAGEIEDVLRKVPGAAAFYREDKTDYWSSTEYSAAKAWYVGFWDGGVYMAGKYNNRPKRCRLIREL